MSKFPNWVKVSYFDIDQFYDLDQYPELGVNYQEWDDMKHGDINKLVAYTDQTEQDFGPNNENLDDLRASGIEIYLTFYRDRLVPMKSVRPTLPTPGALDDVDEFVSESGTPNIGLVFNEGVYKGIGLGGDPFSDIIEKHFAPHRGETADFDAILDAALKEVYDTFSVQQIADDLE